MEMEWEGGEDRKKCPGEAKKDLRGHSVFLKMIFGEEKMPKIYILRRLGTQTEEGKRAHKRPENHEMGFE